MSQDRNPKGSPVAAKAPAVERSAEQLRHEHSREVLASMGVAVYTTDAEGYITFFNEAAAELWGRRPELGKDKWCGSWRLFHLDGTPMPHDECPMGITLREGRPVRDVQAVAERPDGTRVPFLPYPSPLRDASGALIGAVNVVVDLTIRKRVEAALSDRQQRLDLAMQSARMGIWEWKIDTEEVNWSESLEEIHGLAPGTFAGTLDAYLEDVHPEDRQRVIDTVSHSVETGKHELEYRIIWPDGSVHWLSARGRVNYDAAGRPVEMMGLCMDITERKRAEEADRFLAEATTVLSASALDYSMTLPSLARLAVPYFGDWCAISVVDDDGSVRHLALVHRDPTLAQQAQDLVGRQPFDPGKPYGLARVLRTGESEFCAAVSGDELEKLIGDQGLVEAVRGFGVKSVICVPLLARGRTLGAITLAESGRHYTEVDLSLAQELGRRAGVAFDNARLYEQVIKANEAKDEFLGLMSHELRTPITAIYGGARMLRSRGDNMADEDRARLLSDIEQESERLFRMVEDLLALARMELGQSVTTEPVLTQRVVEKVTSAFMQRKPGRPLEVKIDGQLPPVAAQPTYLEQVLRNMLTNADKYSPDGLPIEVRARHVDGSVEVSVSDRGPGVDEGEAELIFERFYRSADALGPAKGLGLGLTVCKRLIEAQSGHVWARPNQGGGLEVGFQLPIYGEEDGT